MDTTRIAEITRLASPQPAKWIDLAPSYAGPGAAQFSPRTATARGGVVASYDDLGYETISMEVEQVEIEGEVHDTVGQGHMFDLLNTYTDNGDGTQSVDMFGNECQHLAFNAEGARFETCQDSPVMTGSGGTQVTFHPFRARVVASTATPVYWVAPLVGFVSKFMQPTDPIADHPLRVRRFSELPDVAEEERTALENERSRADRVILFESNGQLGFIEPLHDYDDRAARTLAEPADRCATAIIVGAVGSDVGDISDLDRILPRGVLEALRLATGHGVSAPWVELRDASGELVMRFHSRHSVGGCAMGRKTIDEQYHRTTGLLVTRMLASTHAENPDFLVPVKRMCSILDSDQGLEDQLSRACSAAEGLCNYFGVNPATLTELPLPAEQRDEVHRILDSAAAELRTYAATITVNENRAFIERRAEAVERLKRLRIGTTAQLIALLERFGLQDAQVLPTFVAKLKSNGQPQTFERLLDDYRNRMAHGSYLRVESYSLDTAWAFIHHLADILIRIVLSALEFDGTYEPPCLFGSASETRHWATPATITPERLRYES